MLATGPRAVHQALLFRQWSADVTFLSHATAPPADEEAAQLAGHGIGVVEGRWPPSRSSRTAWSGVRLIRAGW